MNHPVNQDVLVRLSGGDFVPLIGLRPTSLPLFSRHLTARCDFGARVLRTRRRASPRPDPSAGAGTPLPSSCD